MTLRLVGVAAAAMMAFAAEASADYLSTTTGGAPATPTIHAVNENGHVSLHNLEANIECASTVEGTPTSHGAGKPVSGPISSLSFTSCTNGWTVTVNNKGSLTVTANGKNHGGTLTSSGATVTASRFGGALICRYLTANTHIGTLTGGNPATLHIEGRIPFHSGSEACGTEPAQWTGDYVTTGALFVGGSYTPPSSPALTSPTGTENASPVHLASEGGHFSIHNPEANIECASTIESTLETNSFGGASGKVNALSFTGCTNGWTVSVQAAGELVVQATSGYNGTVTSSGMTIAASFFFGLVTCRYATNNTHIGTLTGGNPATLHIEGKIPFHSGSEACGTEPSQMTGSYQTTEALYVDPPPAITAPTGSAATSPVHFVSENHVSLHNAERNIECASTLETTLKTTSAGTASGKVNALSFTGCTNGWTVTVNSPGEVTVKALGSYKGTLISHGATVTASSFFGLVTCRYATANTHIGTVIGGNPATLHIEGKLPFHGGTEACGGTEPWQFTGDYQTTGALYIDG